MEYRSTQFHQTREYKVFPCDALLGNLHHFELNLSEANCLVNPVVELDRLVTSLTFYNNWVKVKPD